MNWTGKYIIEADGLCHWRESMTISDPELAKACRDNLLTHLFIESWVQLGVKVGWPECLKAAKQLNREFFNT
jgi:hypothetical protein